LVNLIEKAKPLVSIQDILVKMENKIVIQCDVKCRLKEDGYLVWVEISTIEDNAIKTSRVVTARKRTNADTTTLQMVGIVNSLRREGYFQARIPHSTPSPMAEEIKRYYATSDLQ
jgi:hypothetical protein